MCVCVFVSVCVCVCVCVSVFVLPKKLIRGRYTRNECTCVIWNGERRRMNEVVAYQMKVIKMPSYFTIYLNTMLYFGRKAYVCLF